MPTSDTGKDNNESDDLAMPLPAVSSSEEVGKQRSHPTARFADQIVSARFISARNIAKSSARSIEEANAMIHHVMVNEGSGNPSPRSKLNLIVVSA
jgi:hypothetical protein